MHETAAKLSLSVISADKIIREHLKLRKVLPDGFQHNWSASTRCNLSAG